MDAPSELKSMPLSEAIGRCYVQGQEWLYARIMLGDFIDLMLRRYGTVEQMVEDEPPKEDVVRYKTREEALVADVLSNDDIICSHEWRMYLDEDAWRYCADMPVDPSVLDDRDRERGWNGIVREGNKITYTGEMTYTRAEIADALPILEMNKGMDPSIVMLADNIYLAAPGLNVEGRALYNKRRQMIHDVAGDIGKCFEKLLRWNQAPKKLDEFFSALIKAGMLKHKPEVRFDPERLAYRADVRLGSDWIYVGQDISFFKKISVEEGDGPVFCPWPDDGLILSMALADAEEVADNDPSFRPLIERVYAMQPMLRHDAQRWLENRKREQEGT